MVGLVLVVVDVVVGSGVLLEAVDVVVVGDVVVVTIVVVPAVPFLTEKAFMF